MESAHNWDTVKNRLVPVSVQFIYQAWLYVVTLAMQPESYTHQSQM